MHTAPLLLILWAAPSPRPLARRQETRGLRQTTDQPGHFSSGNLAVSFAAGQVG